MRSREFTTIETALRRCRTSFYCLAAFSFFINLLSFAFPLFLLQIYDRVIPNRSVDTLIFLTIIVLFALFIATSLETLRNAILTKLGRWIDQAGGPPVFEANIVRSKDRNRRITTRQFRHLDAVRNFVGSPNILPLFDGPWVPLFLIALFLMHWLLGVVTVVGVALLLALGFATEMLSKSAIQNADDSETRAHDYATAAMRNADVVEAMGMRSQIADRWTALYKSAADIRDATSGHILMLQALGKFLKTALLVALLVCAAYLIIHSQLSAGSIIAAMILFRRAVAPMENAIGCWKSFRRARDGYQALKQHLAKYGPERTATPVFEFGAGLELNRVTVHFSGRDRPTLRRLSLKLRPGEAIAIVGATASGKTTLAQVLLGNIRPSQGDVMFGRVDVTEVDRGAIGPHIGYLPQSVELFEGTIRENIARLTESDMEPVVAAARRAGVNQMIRSLEMQYETEIGEGGALLSGGQRQRVGLARAVFGNPKLLVLDEPDANLDDPGRRALRRAIERARSDDAMVVVITHRRFDMDMFDRVYELNDGVLVEQARTEHDLPTKAPQDGSRSLEGPREAARPVAGSPEGPLALKPPGEGSRALQAPRERPRVPPPALEAPRALTPPTDAPRALQPPQGPRAQPPAREEPHILKPPAGGARAEPSPPEGGAQPGAPEPQSPKDEPVARIVRTRLFGASASKR